MGFDLFPPNFQPFEQIEKKKLWDIVNGQSAMELVFNRSELPSKELAKLLVNAATSHPKCSDNVTVIVIKL